MTIIDLTNKFIKYRTFKGAMAELSSIVRFLNRTLKVRSIKDSSKNGLQVKGTKTVKRIGFAADGCLDMFKKAKKLKCDMLIVHHGILWKHDYNKLITEKRTAFLKKNRISLYGIHLPLDLNSKYGNNIELCRILNLRKIKKFGKYHKVIVGYKGEFEKKVELKDIAKMLNKKLNTKCRTFPFGKRKIKGIGVISGGGSNMVIDAVKEKLDAYLSGEIDLGARHAAKDAGINYIAAGHYATETLGVKALMPLLSKKFDVETSFIENKVNL